MAADPRKSVYGRDSVGIWSLLRELGLQVKAADPPEPGECWASIKDPDGHELIFISDKASKT